MNKKIDKPYGADEELNKALERFKKETGLSKKEFEKQWKKEHE